MKPHTLTLLKELEQYKSQSDVGLWNVSWKTGRWLYQQVKNSETRSTRAADGQRSEVRDTSKMNMKIKKILEIGTSNGFSTLWLAAAAEEIGAEVWTIESSPKRIPLARETIQKSGLKNIHLMEGHAPEVFDQLPKEIDFVFIDATKKEYLRFFLGLRLLLSNGATIVADNVKSHAEEVQPYLNLVRKECESEFIDIGTGLEVSIFKSSE